MQQPKCYAAIARMHTHTHGHLQKAATQIQRAVGDGGLNLLAPPFTVSSMLKFILHTRYPLGFCNKQKKHNNKKNSFQSKTEPEAVLPILFATDL